MSESITFTVSGMKCGGCENSLTIKLMALEGVESVLASHQQKRVEVGFDLSKISVDDLEDAISEAGFKVEA